MQLTAIASIFIASKLIQISHISMQFCYSNLGHNKYSIKQIEDRECDILRLSEWNISEEPTLYEVFELTIMKIKKEMQGKISQFVMVEFIRDFQSIAFCLLRSAMLLVNISQKSLFTVVSSVITLALGFKL